MKNLFNVLCFLAVIAFFVFPAYAGDVVVVEVFEVGSGDGSIAEQGVDVTWDEAHDCADAYQAPYSYSADVGAESRYDATNSGYRIRRGFFPFDTSSLPDSATVISASLSLYVYNVHTDVDDGNDFISVVQASQASNTTLTTTDFDNCGAVNLPVEGSKRFDISTITDDAFNTWTLNENGIEWIAVGGYTNLGIREGHDVLDDVIAASNARSGIDIHFSEYTGHEPYLTVVYICDYSVAPSVGGDVISVTAMPDDDFNGDGYTNESDVTEYLKLVNYWIKNIWTPNASL